MPITTRSKANDTERHVGFSLGTKREDSSRRIATRKANNKSTLTRIFNNVLDFILNIFLKYSFFISVIITVILMGCMAKYIWTVHVWDKQVAEFNQLYEAEKNVTKTCGMNPIYRQYPERFTECKRAETFLQTNVKTWCMEMIMYKFVGYHWDAFWTEIANIWAGYGKGVAIVAAAGTAFGYVNRQYGVLKAIANTVVNGAKYITNGTADHA